MSGKEQNDSGKDDLNVRLNAIFDYEMDELEAKAYKLCLLWMEKSRKIFPNYQHSTLKSGDPRKSLMFKVCYKLVRETQGILEEKDYPLYVRAQLDVLRHINTGKVCPLIDTNCLVGEKAWKRWKLWKKKFDAISKKPSEANIAPAPGVRKAIDGLNSTKEFLAKTLGPEPTIERYKECYTNNNLFRWINIGKISPYYLCISPYILEIMRDEDLKRLNFDPDLYKNCITDEVKNIFKELFRYEFL